MTRIRLFAGAALAVLAAASANAQSITFFSLPNYEGESVTFNGPVQDMRRTGFNDRAMSARVQGEWDICSDASFGGVCGVLGQDIPDLRSARMANVISSTRPVLQYERLADGIVLYAEPNFRGERRYFREPISDLGRNGFNDLALSIRIGRQPWEICQDSEFRKRCVVVSQDVVNLESLGLGRLVSSIRPVGGWAGPPPPGPHPWPGEPTGPDWGGPPGGPGWSQGQWSASDFGRPDAEGRSAAFFSFPRLRSERVAACFQGQRRCGEEAAHQFCRAAGYRGSAYSSTSRRAGRVVFLDDWRATPQSGVALEDVTCVR